MVFVLQILFMRSAKSYEGKFQEWQEG